MPKGLVLVTRVELSNFLASVEKKAYKMALYGVQDHHVALDIVQEAMLRLSESYHDRPLTELPMLFQRILQNAQRDFYRRQSVRNSHFKLFSDFDSEGEPGEVDPLEWLTTDAEVCHQPQNELERSRILMAIEDEVKKLTPRQREAFLMRYWEGMEIPETAALMGCSQSSVKQHCFRAVRTLALALKSRGIGL